MSDDIRRILDLVAQGKITAAEGEQLLKAITAERSKEAATSGSDTARQSTPQYLRIAVHKVGREGRRNQDVNIRVPLAIVRSGMRLGAIIPGFASDQVRAKLRERGLDVDLARIDPATIESLLRDLGEVNIDVNEGEEQVRITCE